MGRNLVSGAQRFSTTLCRSALSYCPLNKLASLRNCSWSCRRFIPASSCLSFATSAANRRIASDMKSSLPAAIESLSLRTSSETSKFPNSFPSLNPVDVYREHIAENIGAIAGVEPEKVYPRLQWTNTLDKGDLVLPVCHCAFFIVKLANDCWIGTGAANQEQEPVRTQPRIRRQVPRVRPGPPSCSWRRRRCSPRILLQDRASYAPCRVTSHQGQGGLWIKWKHGSERPEGRIKGSEEDHCGVLVA